MNFATYNYLLQIYKDIKRKMILQAIQLFALFLVLAGLKGVLGSDSLGSLLFLLIIMCASFLAVFTLLMFIYNVRFYIEIKKDIKAIRNAN
ncbi:hypothetical protein [Bacillus pumilus]|uniref:hypothetical protein n=1 Tax=Bacillus pumilus TaxID=1408 RepID=UPI0011A4E0C0|nr:hypothetical protein [Bacillus pumilus]